MSTRGDEMVALPGDLHAPLLVAHWQLPPASTRCQLREEAATGDRDGPPFRLHCHHRCHHLSHQLHRGNLPRPSLTPRLCSTLLKRLPSDVLLLLFLLFSIERGLVLRSGRTPHLAISIVLLHRGPRGSNIDLPLQGKGWVLERPNEG